MRLTAWLVAAPVLLAGCSGPSEAELLTSARTALEAGDFKTAAIHSKNGLQKNPRAPEGRFLLGSALLASGDASGALQELEKARELGGSPDRVLPLLAQAMVANGQAKKVVEQFGETTLTDSKAAAELKAQVGWAYFRLDQFDRCEAQVRAALQLDQKNQGARFQSALLDARRGQFDAALAQLDSIIADNPKQVLAHTLKGEMLWGGKGDLDAAAKAYRQALAIEPRNVPAHAGLLHVLQKKGDLAAFRTQVGELKKAVPGAVETQLYETQLALWDGDLARAREGVQLLLRAAPSSPEVMQLAGNVALQSGSVVQARTYFAKAMQFQPGAPAPRRMMAATLLRAGQPAEALQTLKPLLEQSSPGAETLEIAAQAYLQSGDVGKAEGYYRQAAQADPANARARVALAVTQIVKGDSGTGMAALESLASSDKGTSADLALLSIHLAKNDLAAALKDTGRLESKSAGDPLPHLLRGRILRLQKDAAGARASFDKALSLDAGYYPAIAELGAMDLAEGKPEAATQRYEAVLKRDPKNHQAMLALADLRYRAGAKPADVEAMATAAIAANPADPATRLPLIEYRLQQRRAKEALVAAQEAVAAVPDDPTLLEALGRAQLASGESQQALATFRKVAESPASPVETRMRIAELYAGMRNFDAAAEVLNKIVAAAPKYDAANRALIQIALARKRVPEALEVARRVQKQQPDGAVGYLMEAGIHTEQKAWEPAIAAARTALSRERTAAVAIRLHALYLTAGRGAEADRFAEAWRRERPHDADFLFHLGSMALERKDYATAETHYRAVLALQPENALVLNNVAWLLVVQGKPGAVPLAETANRISPEQAVFIDTMARALDADKQTQPALDWARRAVRLAPDRPAYRLNLARLLIRAGDRAQAKQELQQLAALGSRLEEHAEVTRLLATL